MTETVCVAASGTTATFSTSLSLGVRTATVAGVPATILSETAYSVTLSSIPPAGVVVCVTITPVPPPPVVYVNKVNGDSGDISALQIATAATSGYGYTPYNAATLAADALAAAPAETTATIKSALGITTLSGSNTGDQVIPTTLPASDVYAWAKAATKPTYTYTEVGAQVAGSYVTLTSTLTKTTDFTVSTADDWFINNKVGSTCVVTLPAASTNLGRALTFKTMQAQAVNSASSNVVPIDSVTAGTSILLPVIGNWATLVSDGTNWVTMQQAPHNILLLE